MMNKLSRRWQSQDRGAAVSKRAENKGSEKKETQRKVCGNQPERGHSQSGRCEEKPGPQEKGKGDNPQGLETETEG